MRFNILQVLINERNLSSIIIKSKEIQILLKQSQMQTRAHRQAQEASKSSSEASLAKKREEKRQKKELFVVQKQQLKNRCTNATPLNFVGNYAECDEQVKTRLHSHLLTGRLQNKGLRAFALEVSKRIESSVNIASEDNEHFSVPHRLFKRAARKATQFIASISKGILKHQLSEDDLENADTSLQRRIRALKRSERNSKRFTEDQIGNISVAKRTCVTSSSSLANFEQSESHFMKQVAQHPERDMENRVPVLEQEEPEQVSENLARLPRAKKSTIPSLDLATQTYKGRKSDGQKRRLKFNDSIEVYYYPENKEQHDHHLNDDEDDDQDDDDEYFLQSSSPQLSSDEDAEQQLMDPSFEELLLSYITHVLMPLMQESQSSSSAEMAKVGKRARRNEANSLNSSIIKSYESYVEPDMDASDSDKSLTTNDNSFPINGISSALTSSELGTSPTQQQQRSKVRFADEVATQIEEEGLPTQITLTIPSTSLFQKQISNRNKGRSVSFADQVEKPSSPTLSAKCIACLF